jgi:transposase
MVWTPPSRRGVYSAVCCIEGEVMQIARIGLDLAKYVFEIHGVDRHGKTVLRRTLRRSAVTAFFANMPPCLVGMETSNGAHFCRAR